MTAAGVEAPNDDGVEAAGNRAPSRRRMARVAAIQVLYQARMGKRTIAQVVKEFEDHRFDEDIDGMVMNADRAFFGRLTGEVAAREAELAADVDEMLGDGRSLSNMELVLQAILTCGACEIIAFEDVPPKVAIGEYLELADDFFNAGEASLVNGVLHNLAVARRKDEMQA